MTCPWKKPHCRGFVYLNNPPVASTLYISGAWDEAEGKTHYNVFSAVVEDYEWWSAAPWQKMQQMPLTHDVLGEPLVPPNYDLKFYVYGEWGWDWSGPPTVVGADMWVAEANSNRWEEWRTQTHLIGPHCHNRLKIAKFRRARWTYYSTHRW